MRTLFFVFLLFIFTTEIYSQWQPDIHFENSFGYTSLSKSIAASNNLVHVVWHDYRFSTWEIYYKRSTDGGLSWEPDLRLTNNAGQSDNPSIYANGLNVYVVWHDNSTGYFEIYFKKSIDGGISWGPDTRLTYSNYNNANLHPSIFASSQFIRVVWHDLRDGNLEIYYKRSTDDGISWGNDARLTNNPSRSEFPSISAFGSNVYVTWKDDRDGNNEIYFKRSSDNGVSWSSDSRISNDPSDSQFPCVTANGSNVHIVWDDNRFGNQVIFYKKSSDSGINWGSDTQLTSNNLSSIRPSIISSGTNLHLAWYGTNFQSNILYKYSSNSGITWNANSYLSSLVTSHPGPSITTSGQGVHLAWTDNVSIYYKQNPMQNFQPTSASALDFDGVDDYVKLPDNLTESAVAQNTAITIEYWFKGTSLQSAVRFQNGDDFLVAGWFGSHIISNDGSVNNGIPVGAAATDGNWHHIAMTWEKNTVYGFKSYLDGNLIARRNSANVNLPNIINGGYLGCAYGNVEFMNGKLDEVRIWNRALRQSEILQNMNCEIPTTSNGLLANYHFNQGVVNENNSGINTLLDFSGNSFSGNLNNFTLNGSNSNWTAPGGIENGSNCIENFSLFKPNGGENLYGGSTNEIIWYPTSNINNIKIEYSINNGSTWNSIISSYPASNYSYQWTIPNNMTSSQCKIKISDVNDPNIFDVSDGTFTITQVTLSSGLVVHYPFDNNFNDATGNGFDGIPNGNPTFVPGVLGNSVNLVGDNESNCTFYSGGDRIRMPIIDFYSMPSFTISMWIYDNHITCGSETYFFQGDDWAPGMNIQIHNQYPNLLFAVGAIAQQPNQVLIVPYRDQDRNRFVLYTMTYENGVLKAYRDSEYLGSFTQNVNYSSTFSGIASHAWYSGSATSARFHGKIDDFRIYNRSLSQSEIIQLYNLASPIVINSPSSNEILTAGTTKYINWSASSGISNVKLEYILDNGTIWNPISASWPASYNSYPWTVPNISSTECKVRVSDKDNSSVNAESGLFTIQQNNLSQFLNFKIKDETGLVKKIRINSDKDSLKKEIVLNEVKFSIAEISNMKTNKDIKICPNEIIRYKIQKIFLFNELDQIIGKIGFNIFESSINSTGMDVIIYVDNDKASDVKYFENPGWKYFSNQNEHLVYMLIPPFNKIDSVKYLKQSLLFVHGIYGEFPTWGNQPKEIYTSYDGWQLYYPYDMRISDCSNILKKVVNKILSGDPTDSPPYQSQLMKIVAHSMGGLVSRYYIQNNSDHKIDKLLMVSTPNNGSLSSYRIRKNDVGAGTFGDLFGKDQFSPAHIDMSPASELLNYLKSSPIKNLNGRENNKSYLVVAGTKSIFCIPHRESLNQDDGVVSVSSASLLNKQIPLATTYFEHRESPKDISSLIILAFLNEDYDPSIDNNHWYTIIKSNVDGYYSTREDSRKPDNSGNLNATKGNLSFSSSNFTWYVRDILISPAYQNVYYLDFGNIAKSDTYLRKNPDDAINYFLRNKEEGFGNFETLGMNLNTVNDSIKLKLRILKKNDTVRVSFPNDQFQFKTLTTNYINLNLSPDVKILNNSKSNLASNSVALNNSSQSNFYIDNSIDTISFCLAGNIGDTAFTRNNFKLTDPNNNLIDSVYANQHPNIIYRQSLEDAVAYYYIVDPEPGNWSAQYNPNISEPFLIAPIQSPVNPDLFFPDTVYAAGDSIKFFTTLPIEPGVTNLQYTANISFVRRGTNTELNLGNVVMVKKDHNTFGGQFFTRGIGEYRVKLELNCNYNNQNIHRENYNSISVSGINAPISLYPKNDSINVPQTAYFKWNRNYNSEKYDLQIYKLGDTIPAFNYLNVTDTSFVVDSLQRETSYFWRIRALNNVDTSNWSEIKFFTSIVNKPDSVALNSPPDKSGGVFTPLSLQWNRSYNAENYQCQISTDSLFANLVFNDSTIIDTITTVDDLIFPQTYYWRVRAVNAGGSSEYSNAWTFNTVEPVSQSFVYVNVIPQGLFNLSNSSLNKSDTVTAYLINTSSPFTVIDSSKAVLDSSSFQASFEFSNAESGIYYLKIKHRNSIETWSKEGGESFNRYGKNYFDFTTSGTQAYGSNMIQINGKWCIYSGDVNQGGNIDLTDVVAINNDATVFSSGYLVTDLNGDYITDLTDLLMGFNNSSMFIAKITP